MDRDIAWTRLEFPSRQVAAEEQERLVSLFVERFDWLGRPPDMALFASAPLHYSSRPAIYFSPACRRHIADFLSIIDARECAPPAGPMIFLAGSSMTRRPGGQELEDLPPGWQSMASPSETPLVR